MPTCSRTDLGSNKSKKDGCFSGKWGGREKMKGDSGEGVIACDWQREFISSTPLAFAVSVSCWTDAQKSAYSLDASANTLPINKDPFRICPKGRFWIIVCRREWNMEAVENVPSFARSDAFSEMTFSWHWMWGRDASFWCKSGLIWSSLFPRLRFSAVRRRTLKAESSSKSCKSRVLYVLAGASFEMDRLRKTKSISAFFGGQIACCYPMRIYPVFLE